MGGTITHLVIADKIIKKLPAGVITDTGMFYAGSLAPDAIHARHSYIRAMKKHTHLRDGIRDMDFMIQDNRRLFHERLDHFIKTNINREGPMLDVYRGYISHLLSDEVFVTTARQKLVELVAKEGIGQRDRKFIERFAPEVHNNDIILSQTYPDIQHIKKSLDKIPRFEIEDFLTADEIKRSRDWVINNFLSGKRKPGRLRYITAQDISAYIEQSVDYSIEYLKLKQMLLK